MMAFWASGLCPSGITNMPGVGPPLESIIAGLGPLNSITSGLGPCQGPPRTTVMAFLGLPYLPLDSLLLS